MDSTNCGIELAHLQVSRLFDTTKSTYPKYNNYDYCILLLGAVAEYRFNIPEGPEDSPIYWDDVQCLGTELRLDDCVFDTNTEDCIHFFQDSGVTCQP